MGWFYGYEYVKRPNRNIDRKASAIKVIDWESDTEKLDVVDAVMVGSVCYMAARKTSKSNEYCPVVMGLVVLTDFSDGQFGYKAISENCGPVQCDCPKRIIELLTPTENEWALAWRSACLRNSEIKAKTKSARNRLDKLPVGTTIEWNDGTVVHRAIKMAPAHQFRKPWFKDAKDYFYWRKSHIARYDWNIVDSTLLG